MSNKNMFWPDKEILRKPNRIWDAYASPQPLEPIKKGPAAFSG
jgi:hypothetical protein